MRPKKFKDMDFKEFKIGLNFALTPLLSLCFGLIFLGGELYLANRSGWIIGNIRPWMIYSYFWMIWGLAKYILILDERYILSSLVIIKSNPVIGKKWAVMSTSYVTILWTIVGIIGCSCRSNDLSWVNKQLHTSNN